MDAGAPNSTSAIEKAPMRTPPTRAGRTKPSTGVTFVAPRNRERCRPTSTASRERSKGSLLSASMRKSIRWRSTSGLRCQRALHPVLEGDGLAAEPRAAPSLSTPSAVVGKVSGHIALPRKYVYALSVGGACGIISSMEDMLASGACWHLSIDHEPCEGFAPGVGGGHPVVAGRAELLSRDRLGGQGI